MYSSCPWSAQNPGQGQEPGRCSLSPATTQAQGKSTSPAARSEQGEKTPALSHISFPWARAGTEGRDRAACWLGLAAWLGSCRASMPYQCCEGMMFLCLNILTSNHLCLQGRMLILSIFFQYVLSVLSVFAIQLLEGGYMLVWGPDSVAEHCQHSLCQSDWSLWLKCHPPSQGWSLSAFLLLLRLLWCNWICPFCHAWGSGLRERSAF